MKTLKFLSLVGVIFFSAMSMMAQPRHRVQLTPEQQAERMTNSMTEKLSLSAKQAKQIKKVYLSNMEAMQKAREANIAAKQAGEKGSNPREAYLQKMDSSFKKILTPEQYTQWKEDRARIRKHRPMHPGPQLQPAQ